MRPIVCVGEQFLTVHIKALDGREQYRHGVPIAVTLSTRADPYRLPPGESYRVEGDPYPTGKWFRRAESDANTLAAHVCEWVGFVDTDGAPLPCTRTTVVGMLRLRPVIFNQLRNALRDAMPTAR